MIWVDLRQRTAKLARLSVPALTTVCLLLATLLPWWPFATPIAGVLTLAAVFFWSLHRPDAMPAWLAAALGLFGDILGIAPLGVGMFCALVTCGLAGWRRRDLARASKLIVWGAFAATMGAVALLGWILAAIANGGWHEIGGSLIQPFIGVVAYPILSYFLAKADRAAFRP